MPSCVKFVLHKWFWNVKSHKICLVSHIFRSEKLKLVDIQNCILKLGGCRQQDRIKFIHRLPRTYLKHKWKWVFLIIWIYVLNHPESHFVFGKLATFSTTYFPKYFIILHKIGPKAGNIESKLLWTIRWSVYCGEHDIYLSTFYR